MSEQIRNFGKRGTTMGVVCVAAIGGALAVMYGLGKDVKQKEGRASVYKQGDVRSGGSDVKMTSGDVAAVVSGKERLPSSASDK